MHRVPDAASLRCGLVAIAFAAATPAIAQIAGATVRGNITTYDEPAPGATVVATNTATGVAVRTTSNAAGDIRAGRVAARDLLDRGQCAGPGERAAHHRAGRAERFAEPHARRAARRRPTPMVVTSTRENRTSEVGTHVTQKQIDSLPQTTRNFLSFADLAPGAIFTTDKRRLDAAARRRATFRGDQRLHRRHRPEELRAARRHHRPGLEPRQPVSAIGDRRIQGHHAELQGRVRPDLERRGHRGDQVGHQRVPWRGVLGSFERRMACTDAGREGRRQQDRRRRKTSTASRSAARSCRTACTGSWPTKASRSTRRSTVTVGPGPHGRRPADRRCRVWSAARRRRSSEDLLFGKLDWSIDDSNLSS